MLALIEYIKRIFNLSSQKYQFGHIQTFARSVSKKRKEGAAWAISDIVAEASRIPEASLHVKNPTAPTHVAGIAINDLESEVERQIADVRMSDGRALRKDSHVLLACVYSWPEHVNYYDKDRFELWILDILEFHQTEFNKVDCAVVHLDESFPHLHVYTISSDARSLSPGWSAKRQAMAASQKLGNDKKTCLRDGNGAYRAAMKLWQDRYHGQVGQYHALDRLGPGRKRIPRKDFRAGKKGRVYEAELRFSQRSNLKNKMQEIENIDELAQQSLMRAKEETKIALAEKEKAKKELERAHQTRLKALEELETARASAANLAPWLYSSSVISAILWKVLSQFGIEPRAVKLIRKKAILVIKDIERKYQKALSEFNKKEQNLSEKLKAEKEKQLHLSQQNSKLEMKNSGLLSRVNELEKHNQELSVKNYELLSKLKSNESPSEKFIL